VSSREELLAQENSAETLATLESIAANVAAAGGFPGVGRLLLRTPSLLHRTRRNRLARRGPAHWRRASRRLFTRRATRRAGK
jgi:hypothetical protein